MGVTAPMLGGDGWDSPDLSPASAAGGYFANHYTSDATTPIVLECVFIAFTGHGAQAENNLYTLATSDTQFVGGERIRNGTGSLARSWR